MAERRPRVILWNKIILLIILTILLCGIIITYNSKVCKSQTSFYSILVGDSRMTEMESVLSEEQKTNCFFVAKRHIGYNWLKDTAMDSVQQIIDDNPDIQFNIVFALGVNDLKSSSKYISFYNETVSEQFKDHKLYIMSVNPVMEEVLTSHGFKARNNKQITAFNENMQESIVDDFTYIDTYDALVNKEGFGTVDGLHYIAYTYKRLFGIIMENIESNQIDDVVEY